MTLIQGFIDDYTMRRASHTPSKFVRTDCAFALLMKQLFPGIHVHATFMAFCDHNGREITIPLGDDIQDWLLEWDKTPMAERSNMRNLKFELEIPQSAIDSIGPVTFDRLIKSNRNLRKVELEEVLV